MQVWFINYIDKEIWDGQEEMEDLCEFGNIILFDSWNDEEEEE